MDSALSIYVPEKYYFTVAGLVFVPLVMLVTDLVTDTHLSLIKVTPTRKPCKSQNSKKNTISRVVIVFDQKMIFKLPLPISTISTNGIQICCRKILLRMEKIMVSTLVSGRAA